MRKLQPAHGGTDSGKVGINGVKEKDINLTITNSVKKILEKENIQVIMTREIDEQLAQSKVEDLKYRVKIMNEVSPVLAVSIHQNSYHEENVFGAQVFYYQTSTEGEKAAGIIQDALQKVNPDNTKKIKANNTYYILKKTEVPTVIVECGFLSNYKEAQKLVTEDYQKSVAEAVAEGILSYIKENE
nr:N-acetylmuramoyl-L-alanine amidase [uncultured Mediterraneibacter sp.]